MKVANLRLLFVLTVSASVVLGFGVNQADGRALAASELPSRHGPEPEVRDSTRSDSTPPLRDMPAVLREPSRLRELPLKQLPNRIGSIPSEESDPVVQDAHGIGSLSNTITNFEGISNVDGVLPPDSVGDVGLNHYVQMVNLSIAIWDKAGNQLLSPRDINTLWQGFGGPCEGTNDGDPIVLYDELADRWMASQFALPNFPFGPFYECIAISQSGDPTDSWYRYEFKISNTKMNDYPKFGVWPDGYYMAVNQFNQASLSWGGQGVVAFERDKMLAGQPAKMVYFDLYSQDPNLGGMLPSDLDGPPPPLGASNLYVQIDDNAWGPWPDRLQVWEFTVDWDNARNASFNPVALVNTDAFDSNLCGYSRNCISQPGGTPLDAISDLLMYRLQYRRFDSYQTLMVNHTVDANGADRAGIRWYELRDSGGGWSIHQQGTYSPDADHRWMGSLAMDSDGNIALGYSVSSDSVSPSIRYAGRLAGDPLGTLTQGETTLIAGTGYQQHSSGRWGDYSMMSVDPSDGCTFWYTQEYYATISNASWQTRIGSFKFDECTGTPSPTATTPSSTATPTPGDRATRTPGPTATRRSRSTSTPSATISPGPTATPGPSATYTPGPSATDTPGPTATPNSRNGSMHVGDLDAMSQDQGGIWQATAMILVHDKSENALPGIDVSGRWTGGTRGLAFCTTNSSGQCTVTKSQLAFSLPSVTFIVVDLIDTLPYRGTDNHDPDGDSNGKSIVISFP